MDISKELLGNSFMLRNFSFTNRIVLFFPQKIMSFVLPDKSLPQNLQSS